MSEHIWKTLQAQSFRAKFLVTGNTVQTDTETGEKRPVHFNWSIRWAISGVHSHNWRWVQRLGKLSCGCIRNPVTRRRLPSRRRCAGFAHR
jgi:hypothetical protein